MNILFYLDHSISSGFGGIEHTTEQVVNVLSQNGFSCFSIYRYQSIEEENQAPLFIMASAQEGWGLVITEAQQMGCVPIVLNTFPSASDLINNTRNGYLVNTMNVFRKTLK